MQSQPESPVLVTRLNPEALNTLAEGARQIERIVGFCSDEVHAQQLYRRLRTEVGLAALNLLVLKPEDGVAWRFARAAQAWRKTRAADNALRPEHRGAGALLGAAIVGLLSWGMTLLDATQSGAAAMTALLLGAVWGALIGFLVVILMERVPKVYRFDRNLQRELKAGAHAVVVLAVPPNCQAEVLALVRGNSRGWCADAPRARRGWLGWLFGG